MTTAESPRVLDDRAAALLADAADWRLLGLLCERPRPADWQREVAALARGSCDPELAVAAGEARAAAEGPYLALLGPGGAVSPREVGHRQRADPGHLLAEIQEFYRAFAYQPRAEDPPDHIAVEAGFVAYLHLKRAYAAASGDAQAEEVTKRAAERFLRDHLAGLAAPLAGALAAVAPGGYLARVAALLCRRAGPPPAEAAADGLPEDLAAADCALTCGPPEAG